MIEDILISIGVLIALISLVSNIININNAFNNPQPKWKDMEFYECDCCGADVDSEEITGECCPSCRCSKTKNSDKWWRKTL